MAPRRLVPAHVANTGETQLRAALGEALDAQRRDVAARMRSSGLTPPSSLVAAAGDSKKRKTMAATAFVVWNGQTWQRNVTSYVHPVALRLAKAAELAAVAALPAALTWGILSKAASIADRITGTAVTAGNAIGTRLDTAASLVSGSSSAVDDVIATAPAILDNTVGSMALMAAESASFDALIWMASVNGTNPYPDASVSWVNEGDDRVRDAHQDVDDVTVNQPFDVGGEQLYYPGDPEGSDWNIMGCRCHTETDGVPGPDGGG